MYVCMSVYRYVRVYVCIMHLSRYVFCVCIYICMNVCIYICMNVCKYACMYIYVRMSVCKYVCMYIRMYVCMCLVRLVVVIETD